MLLSPLDIVLAITVVSVGAMVQGSIGFGLAIVSAPVLYMINPELVPGPIIFTALLVGLLTAHRHRRDLHISDMQYAIIGRVPGSVLGGLLLTVVSARAMSVLLGGAVLMAVVASLTSIRFQANRRSLFTAGVLSGVMGTASSIGGPPMALVMQNEEQNRIRANLSAFFVASCIISLAVLWATGLFGWEHVLYGVYMMPGALVGSWLASKVSDKVNPAMMKQSLLWLCSLSGISAIVTAFH